MAQEPPPADHYLSAAEKEFFYQVGTAVTDWAHVDERLFQVFAAVLKAKLQHAAIIYYRTQTISGRLALVDELVKTVLPAKDRPDGGKDHPATTAWKKLYKDIDAELSVRNQLAHSPSAPKAEISDRPDDTFAITDIWWASYTSDTQKLRGASQERKDLKVDDITAHIQVVSQLWMRLREFEDAVSSLLAR